MNKNRLFVKQNLRNMVKNKTYCTEYKSLDKLDDMFKRQKTFLETYFGKDIGTQGFINSMVLAAIVELTETLNETPWKPWKQNQCFNLENYIDEVVDVLHFLLNLCISVGITSDELYDRFATKNNINFQRQVEGY